MAQFTKKAILQTFEDLLDQKPFDKITVSSIVAKCGISSNTFYYHYRDIYDLLKAWIDGKKEKYLFAESPCWQDAWKAILQDMKSRPKLIYHLFQSLSRDRVEYFMYEELTERFYELIRVSLEDTTVSEKVMQSAAEYTSYAVMGSFLKFLWYQMNVDIDEMVDEVGHIFEGSVFWIKVNADHHKK